MKFSRLTIFLLGDAISPHIKKIWRNMNDRGHDVIVFTRKMDPDWEGKQVRLIDVPRGLLAYILFPFAAIANALIIKLWVYIYRPKDTIIHAHWPYTYGLVARLTGEKYFVSVWGGDVFYHSKKNPILKLVNQFVFSGSYKVLTTTEHMKSTILKEYSLPANKVIRIAWGVALSDINKKLTNKKEVIKKFKSKYSIPTDATIVTHIRQASPAYNIDIIIEAAKRLLLQNKNLYFIFIAYKASQKNSLNSKIQKFPREIINRIRILPMLSKEEWYDLLISTDIAISIPNFDQFGTSVLESMACGCIPVVSNLDVYKTYLKDGINAFIFKKDEGIEGLSRTLLYIIPKVKDLKRTFHKINLKIIRENEDEEKCMSKLEEVYMT